MESIVSSFAYSGSIPEAISEARREKKLFVVYISGEDEDSIRLEQSTWADSKVPDAISKYCIFLHLRKGSLEASQFSAIYPSTAFPSITAVGFSGAVVWRHEGYVDADKFIENIQKAWASLHLQETTAKLLAAALVSNNSDHGSSSFSNGAAQVVERGSTSFDISSSHRNIPASNPEEVVDQRDHNDLNINIEDAKHEETFSLPSKQDDLIHGEGQSFSSVEMNKEISHLESEVLVRSTKDGSPSASDSKSDGGTFVRERGSSGSFGTISNHEAVEVTHDATNADDGGGSSSVLTSNNVHINIRLPDGSSLQTKIVTSDTLKVIKNYVDQNVGGDFQPYNLAVPYPFQVFNDEDIDKSLFEVGFAKRQALIVIPVRRAYNSPAGQSSRPASSIAMDEYGSNASADGYFGYLKRILSYANPFSYFGGNGDGSNPQHTREESLQQHTGQPYNLSSHQNPAAFDGAGGGARRQSRGFGSNIHTLRRYEDEGRFGPPGDHNMFWNGNSTQFGGSDSK